MPSEIRFKHREQLTVGELKKHLEDYPEDAVIYMETSNAYNKNNTMWSQKVLDTYPCKQHMTSKKALMIVGDLR